MQKNFLFYGPQKTFQRFWGPPKFFYLFYGPQAKKVWETLPYTNPATLYKTHLEHRCTRFENPGGGSGRFLSNFGREGIQGL